MTSDHLGSPRINTDKYGDVISRHDYHPFGEEIAINKGGYGGDSIRKKFTGYERDGESGLDFAQSRYHNYNLGRFSSPDQPFADQFEGNPQSWNLYSYVRNNPLNMTDPLGMAGGCPERFPDCIEENGKFYVSVNGEKTIIDENILHIDSGVTSNDGITGSIVHEDGSRTLTVGEAHQQQAENRRKFYLNNILAGVGHGLGKLFNGISGLFRGKSPTPPPATATTTTATSLPQFSKSTLEKAVEMTMKQKGNHIFRGKNHPKPHLNQLAQQSGGEDKLIGNVLQNINGQLPMSGQFEVQTVVNGVNLTIRGFVNNGIPIINTMF